VILFVAVGSAFLPLLFSIVDAEEVIIVGGFTIGTGEVAMYWDAAAATTTTGVPLRSATDEARVGTGTGVEESSANTGLLSMGDNGGSVVLDCASG